MKRLWLIISIVLLALIVWGGIFYWNNLRGIWPAIQTPIKDISTVINTTGMPLNLPPGFSISVFAKVPGARVLKFDDQGSLWVSQTSQGAITRLDIQNGSVTRTVQLLTGLQNPHGLAFDPDNPSILYVAQENSISKVYLNSASPIEKIADLPSGGHVTRTLGFGLDKRLYVSIGSSCNVCQETDNRRASIISLKRDGSDVKTVARGLRNAVFFTWNPANGKMWGTEMGRDFLGDNTPPDEVNIIEQGKNYGWPNCYGKNVHDTNFDHNTYIQNPCQEPFQTPSFIDIPAHSAPLGLAFPPKQGWPQEYQDNLLVAYHGSWNRSAPTGYKIVRFKPNGQGGYGPAQDFISGWLAGGNALGRPVDLVVHEGALYISDDKAGIIYQVRPE